jgi:hypothetical protein
LWNEDGGGGGVAGFNRLIPMPSTSPGPGGLWGLTRTTAQDQVALVRNVAYPNSVLGSSQRAYEQGLMQHVTSSQRWGVSGGVPSGVGIALKNGWLPVSGGWEINSIGHIFGHGKDYVIAVLTSGNPSMGYGISTIQGVASIVWSQLPQGGGTGGAGPSVAVGADGRQYVFWKGADGNLWEQFWNGSAWAGPFSLGMGPLGSEPSAGVDGNGATYVFWQGVDGVLREAFWNGSGWVGPVRGSPVASRPGVAVGANGHQYVFWKAADGSLWEAFWNGAAWAGPFGLGMGPLGSAPSAGVDGNGATYVFWQGVDGVLTEAFWNGSGWVGPVRGSPVASQPTVAVGSNAHQYVFWKAADATLWEAFWNGAGWAGPFGLGMGPLGSAPSAGVDGHGATYVFWRGVDNVLTEGFWNGSGWVGPVRLSAMR